MSFIPANFAGSSRLLPEQLSLMTAIADLPITTEEKIRLAAIRVFTHKGYDGTKTRDIAEAAGINVATLHYYHRTKEQLFTLVAREMMDKFLQIYKEIFAHDLSLPERIYALVERYTDLFYEQPDLAMFCVSESDRNPAAFQKIIDFKEASQVMTAQLADLAAAGEIRELAPQNFINVVVGMTIYPFLTRGTIISIVGMDDGGFRAMLEEQKRIIPQMVIDYLYQK